MISTYNADRSLMVLAIVTLSLIAMDMASLIIAEQSENIVVYRIIYPEGRVMDYSIDPCIDHAVYINYTISIPVNLFFLKEKMKNLSFQETTIDIDLGTKIARFVTMHTIYSLNDVFYELYYEKQTGILVYAIITDKSLVNEYEIAIYNATLPHCLYSTTTSKTDTFTTSYTTTTSHTFTTGETTATTTPPPPSPTYSFIGPIIVIISITILLLLGIHVFIGRRKT